MFAAGQDRSQCFCVFFSNCKHTNDVYCKSRKNKTKVKRETPQTLELKSAVRVPTRKLNITFKIMVLQLHASQTSIRLFISNYYDRASKRKCVFRFCLV